MALDRTKGAEDRARQELAEILGPLYRSESTAWLLNFVALGRLVEATKGSSKEISAATLDRLKGLVRRAGQISFWNRVFRPANIVVPTVPDTTERAVDERFQRVAQMLRDGTASQQVRDWMLDTFFFRRPEQRIREGMSEFAPIAGFAGLFGDLNPDLVVAPAPTPTPSPATSPEAKGQNGATAAGGDALNVTEVPGGLGGPGSDGAAPTGGDAGGGGTPGTPAAPGGSGTPSEGGPRQIPGGGQLWKVDGTFYLAYRNPKHAGLWMTWEVEDTERLEAIYGTTTPKVDRTLTRAQYEALGPWRGGLAAELVVTDKNPWQVFNEQLRTAAELRPWILDPSVQAVMQVAYLEDRDPTADELALTDWWNNHTAAERAWMEDSVTLGDKEVQRRKNDTVRNVAQTLRAAGMANPPDALVEYIASQSLTGRWSADYTAEQVRKVADPFAPGTLDKGIAAVLTNLDFGNAGDLHAVSQGWDATMSRVLDIFDAANVPIATANETEEERLNRITGEVISGQRTMKSVRDSVNLIALETPGGVVGGLDVTSEGEDRVRMLLLDWLGPAVAQGYDDRWVKEWAGRLRNDPDAELELNDLLREVAKTTFSEWGESAKYANIAPYAMSTFQQVWGEVPDETDPLFLDVLNMRSRSEASKLLRTEGINRNQPKVWQDATAAFEATPAGDRVVRSTI